MADLIDRQAAIYALEKALYEYEDETEQKFQASDELNIDDWFIHRIFVQNMNDIDIQTIVNLPPVDPVEHGHWIKIGEIDKAGNQYYQCSKCGKGEIHVPTIDVKYCWNCGARMDEEADHDDHL